MADDPIPDKATGLEQGVAYRFQHTWPEWTGRPPETKTGILVKVTRKANGERVAKLRTRYSDYLVGVRDILGRADEFPPPVRYLCPGCGRSFDFDHAVTPVYPVHYVEPRARGGPKPPLCHEGGFLALPSHRPQEVR